MTETVAAVTLLCAGSGSATTRARGASNSQDFECHSPSHARRTERCCKSATTKLVQRHLGRMFGPFRLFLSGSPFTRYGSVCLLLPLPQQHSRRYLGVPLVSTDTTVLPGRLLAPEYRYEPSRVNPSDDDELSWLTSDSAPLPARDLVPIFTGTNFLYR